MDLPQPEGPISAVTARGGIAIVIFRSACFFPYQNEKSFASIVPMRFGLNRSAIGASAVIRTFP